MLIALVNEQNVYCCVAEDALRRCAVNHCRLKDATDSRFLAALGFGPTLQGRVAAKLKEGKTPTKAVQEVLLLNQFCDRNKVCKACKGGVKKQRRKTSERRARLGV